MGSLIDGVALKKVLSYIASAKSEGARLICGGKQPSDPALKNGCFVEPTVFADVYSPPSTVS